MQSLRDNLGKAVSTKQGEKPEYSIKDSVFNCLRVDRQIYQA